MKLKTFLSILFLLTVWTSSYGIHSYGNFVQQDSTTCDTLYLKSGTILVVSIEDISNARIYYLNCNLPSSSIQYIELEKVNSYTKPFSTDLQCDLILLKSGLSYEIKVQKIEDDKMHLKLCNKPDKMVKIIPLSSISNYTKYEDRKIKKSSSFEITKNTNSKTNSSKDPYFKKKEFEDRTLIVGISGALSILLFWGLLLTFASISLSGIILLAILTAVFISTIISLFTKKPFVLRAFKAAVLSGLGSILAFVLLLFLRQ